MEECCKVLRSINMLRIFFLNVLPMTMGGEARGIVRVKKVHRAVAVEVRSPIVGVDQHRSGGQGSYVRHCPYHLRQG